MQNDRYPTNIPTKMTSNFPVFKVESTPWGWQNTEGKKLRALPRSGVDGLDCSRSEFGHWKLV